MEIFEHWDALPGGLRPTAVALGYFDGLHLGHQAVIRAAVRAAGEKGLAPAVFTFTQPAGGKGPLILTPGQKHALLEKLGVECCFEPAFETFKNLAPQQFVDRLLVEAFGAKALFCGADFAFGAGRAGDTTALGALAAARGVALQVAPLAAYAGAPISASRIRGALAAGDMEQAAAMLGRPYAIDFPVEHGRQLGSQLGFPTINQLFTPGVQAPAYGVYITRAVVDGRAWPSATGYGTRPTVDGGAPTCETFIPGFEGDLYGRTVTVEFYKRIAETTRFGSLQQLTDAVHDWAAQARDYFEKKRGGEA